MWKWNKTFNKIEKALGFELYEWQRDYIMMVSDYIPSERQCGATTAFILRNLLNYGSKLGTYEEALLYKFEYDYNKFPRDNYYNPSYAFNIYPGFVINIDKALKSVGIDTCFKTYDEVS